MKGEVSNGVLMRVGRVDLKMPELPKRPVPYKEITNSLGMKLVYIAPGKFLMGTSAAEQEQLIRESGEPGDAKIWLDAEGPQHEVEITEGFYIGKYVVTQEEYQKLTGKNPSRFSATGEGARRVAGLETRRFPVEQVSWEEAKEFCRLLSAKEGKYYSLPTEAEWEYAARADTVTPYAFGTTLSPNQANVHDSKLERTDSVDHYPANPWGLCDVHGNVAQWCEDWYSKRAYKRGDCKDPEGPAVGNTRVTRGGRWNFSPFLARSACRYSCDPSNHDAGIGFRVVLRTTDKRIAKQQSPN
jgi:formylglycine-generating enzyme required for sulfatase activity